MAKQKADIFAFLNAMNSGDFRYVEEMSDEEVKSLSPFVLSMWANGAKSNTGIHVWTTDAYCNDKIFSLTRHPRLLLKLFVAANSEIDNTRYAFQKSVQTSNKKKVEVLCKVYDIGVTEAQIMLELLTEEELKEAEEIYADS